MFPRGFKASLFPFAARKPEANMARLGAAVQALVALPIIFVSAVGAQAQTTDKPPFWAYTYNPPDFKPAPDDGQPRRVPDSTVSYTVPQTRDRFLAPDWHPGDHPAMPTVVASGRAPDVYACGFCHRASGTGGPENADIAGLPVAYFIQQMQDFRSGKRATALPDRIPQAWMISVAKASNDDEIKAAAEYFAAIKPKKLVDVVETETVPKPTVAGWFFVTQGDERELIGMRIIETPADVGRFVNRDARVRFTAYVPPGSVAAGRELALKPEIACASCHGEKLTGTDVVPGIAGRSPTYIFRQLYEYRNGFRAGPESKPMIDVVKTLNEADFLPLAAYLATLER
ncbi:c-type cytochrome [Bradyrhizobium sp. PMVTL-01]|uniref:c-type cytochrome n=1 Tax=Bradyrhizobium sp. PMVTL-01 TaxID=3434999 RepID=UPI003F7184D7